MARLIFSFYSKLKASSLLEVIVAMTIIMGVFGVAMMVYSQTFVKAKQRKKVDAVVMVDALIIDALEEKDYFDRTFEEDLFKVTKTVESDTEAKVMRIKFVVNDKISNALIWEVEKVMRP